MLARLIRLLRNPVTEISRSARDTTLGELRLSGGGKWWEASIEVNGELLGFKIGGRLTPDPVLLTHAHDIIHSFTDFQKLIREFLTDEARGVKHLRQFAHEIEQLRIEDV